MKPCAKCPILRAEWREANEIRIAAITRYGSFSTEVALAEKVEFKARRKVIHHSVGCESASKELLHLIALERSRRAAAQPRVS